jgi:hypothetical protein
LGACDLVDQHALTAPELGGAMVAGANLGVAAQLA